MTKGTTLGLFLLLVLNSRRVIQFMAATSLNWLLIRKILAVTLMN